MDLGRFPLLSVRGLLRSALKLSMSYHLSSAVLGRTVSPRYNLGTASIFQLVVRLMLLQCANHQEVDRLASSFETWHLDQLSPGSKKIKWYKDMLRVKYTFSFRSHLRRYRVN
jgi:hypothetical protein